MAFPWLWDITEVWHHRRGEVGQHRAAPGGGRGCGALGHRPGGRGKSGRSRIRGLVLDNIPFFWWDVVMEDIYIIYSNTMGYLYTYIF